MNKQQKGMLISLLTVTILLPYLIQNEFYLHVLTTVLVYAGLASSWNILGGYAGQLSLGHTAFFGIGAYTSTLLYVYFGISPWIGMLVGGLLAVLVSFVTLYPSFRLRGVFFAMVTISFGEVIRILFVYFRNKTTIPYGVTINYEPSFLNMIFEGSMGYFYVSLAYLLVIMFISWKVKHSRLGFFLNALKENDDAAQALGVPTSLAKFYALAISAFFTAIGGTIMIQNILYLEPESAFASSISTELALISIIGGIGTVAGPVIGAIILIPLGELLRAWFSNSAQGLHLVIYGALLMVVVLKNPNGIMGFISSFKTKRKKKNEVKREEVSSVKG
jgi:branched-chain amino acid transport system permease protein